MHVSVDMTLITQPSTILPPARNKASGPLRAQPQCERNSPPMPKFAANELGVKQITEVSS
jgi:hypothetical protein